MSVVGLSQESVMAWGDSWTEEAFWMGPLAECISWWSVGSWHEKETMKSSGSLTTTVITQHYPFHLRTRRMVRLPLTDGWITVWITEQLCFATFLHLDFVFLADCQLTATPTFDLPTNYLLFFRFLNETEVGSEKQTSFWLGSPLCINIKAFGNTPAHFEIPLMNHPLVFGNQSQATNNFVKGFWVGGYVLFILFSLKTIPPVVMDLLPFFILHQSCLESEWYHLGNKNREHKYNQSSKLWGKYTSVWLQVFFSRCFGSQSSHTWQ